MRSYLNGGAAALAVIAGLVFAGPAAASASPVVGHVYVNDNTTTANTVSGFDRHANGRLTPMPGSPFQAGGAGTGSGLASQGSVQVSPNGRYLLVADAGSNQISVLGISQSGGLALLHVVESGGIGPVSVAVNHGFVYVANAGTGGSNYTGFLLGQNGSCGRSRARRSRCPTQRSPATFCSTQPGRSSSAPGSARRRSTASRSVATGG